MKKLLLLCLSIWHISGTLIANEQKGEILILPEAVNIMGISPNGKYVTGYIFGGNKNGFIWSESSGYDYLGDIPATINDVSDNGIVIGQFEDEDFAYQTSTETRYMKSAGYFKDGEWHSLGFKEGVIIDGTNPSYANGISADGTTICGTMYDVDHKMRPVVWKDGIPTDLDTGEYDIAKASVVSDDGTIIGGFVSGNRYPVLWIDGKLTHLTRNGSIENGEVLDISPNKKYVSLTIGNELARYDLDNKTFTIIPKLINYRGGYPLSVSDDGIVVGYLTDRFNDRDAFIYSDRIGTIHLMEYLNKMEINYSGITQMIGVQGISGDGLRLAGNGHYQGKMLGWILSLNTHLDAVNRNRPKNPLVSETGNRSVKIEWESAEPETGYILSGYNIYRNGEKINEEIITELSFQEEGLTDGSYTYTITAVWNGEQESEPTAGRKINIGNFVLPFYEEFKSGSLDTNYWNTNSSENSNWKISFVYGLMPPCLSYFTPASQYSEYITSPYLDATNSDNINLAFNWSLTNEKSDVNSNLLTIELFDGENWYNIKEYKAIDKEFTPESIDISKWAARKNIRIRFTVSGDNTGKGDLVWLIDNIRIYDHSDEIIIDKPMAFNAYRDEKGYVNMSWSDPNGNSELSYINTENLREGIGNKGEYFIAANMFNEEDLKAYEGYKMTSISAYILCPTENIECNIVVFSGKDRVLTQPVEAESMKWNTFLLDTPLTIDAGKPLYYGIEVLNHFNGDLAIGLNDKDEIDGKSNLIWEEGYNDWKTLKELGTSFSLNIKAAIVKDINITKKEGVLGYILYRNGKKIFSDDDVVATFNWIDKEAPLSECCYKISAFYYMPQKESESTEEVCVKEYEEGSNILQKPIESIEVYPTLTDNYLYIKGNFTEATLYTLTGVTILISTQNQVNMKKVPSGNYILQIKTPQGEVIKKISKK